MEQESNQRKKEMIDRAKAIEEEKLKEKENYENEINRLQTALQFKVIFDIV